MAGWRVGFAVGSATLIARIQTGMDHIAAGVWTGVQRVVWLRRCAPIRLTSPPAAPLTGHAATCWSTR